MSLAYDSERRYVNLDGEPVHEDTLPEDMSDADYGEWFGRSFVPGGVGCRVGPPVQRVVPKEQLDAALARIERLEAICASVYQYVGIDAPVRFLDALALHDEYMQMTPDQIIETLLPTWKDDPADAAQRGGE